MIERPIKKPGPQHPITIFENPARVTVAVNGEILADTYAALTMDEAMYPRVFYIPRTDVDMGKLTRSAHTTYCPFKGDCSYYSLPAAGERGENVVWTYEHPFEWMEQIEGYLAFYPDRVTITERTA